MPICYKHLSFIITLIFKSALSLSYIYFCMSQHFIQCRKWMNTDSISISSIQCKANLLNVISGLTQFSFKFINSVWHHHTSQLRDFSLFLTDKFNLSCTTVINMNTHNEQRIPIEVIRAIWWKTLILKILQKKY